MDKREQVARAIAESKEFWCGVRNGMALVRGDLSVYLYLTNTGQSVVAYVESDEGQSAGSQKVKESQHV